MSFKVLKKAKWLFNYNVKYRKTFFPFKTLKRVDLESVLCFLIITSELILFSYFLFSLINLKSQANLNNIINKI